MPCGGEGREVRRGDVAYTVCPTAPTLHGAPL